MNAWWPLVVVAIGFVMWAPVAAVVGLRRWKKYTKAKRQRNRVKELAAARQQMVEREEKRRRGNSSWPAAGSRRRTAAVPRETVSVPEHLSLLVEATARLQADVARGLDIMELARRVERLHAHHVFLKERI